MAGRMTAVIRGEEAVVGAHTGNTISVAASGRLRPRNADSTGTVMW